jgi:molecular chaperone GrpE
MSSGEHQIKRNKEVAVEDLSKPDHVPGAEDGPGAEAEAGAETETVEESIEQQLDKAQATIKEYWEQILRLKAEIENNRKRSIRDIENAHKYALRNFSESLLPIVDSMEMAQKAAEAENASLESIIEGTELTMSMFFQVLEKYGLQELDPIGEKFDPEQHQAISMVEDKNAESNTVVSVMQKGFMLNERLVRPAMVVVSK